MGIGSVQIPEILKSRAETNTRFIRISRLHMYSNTKRVLGCTVNDFALILPYFVINYKFKGISVIK